MRKIWICTVGFGLAAAVLYLTSLAHYAYPGESAALLAQLQGLADAPAANAHPLFMAVARLCGGGNLLAPILGTLGCALLFALIAFYVFAQVRQKKLLLQRERLSLLAAGVATLVFALTPAVRSAATHLEPRLFDFVWLLAGFVLVLPFYFKRHSPIWLLTLLLGLWSGFGAIDSVLITMGVPAYALTIYLFTRGRHRRHAYMAPALYLVFAFLSLLLALWIFGKLPSDWILDSYREFRAWRRMPGWLFILVFANLPLLIAYLAVRRSVNGEGGKAQRFTHLGLSVVVVLSVATAFSPSKLALPYGILPVFSSAAAAVTAGYLVAYWWLRRRSVTAIVAGSILALVLSIVVLWNLFVFDTKAGVFADRIADRVLADLGSRQWLVTDGALDNHLRLQAAKQGREVKLISLNRDLDRGYLEELSALVKREGIGGAKNASLVLSAQLGVLPFLNDWFACDASVKTNVAVWGAPDLWYAAGITPVPELFFFGADPQCQPDWNAWKEFDPLLKVPKGWGSYRDRGETDPVARLRQSLRRHVGLVANDRGVYLQDKGDNDAAWKMYELVLGEIDRDNICAIFNEVAMIGLKHPSAVAKRRDLERMIKSAVDDKNRRYLLWRLGAYYGYIRDPAIFIKLGHGWARSGRPGEALAQIRRAIDIVPDDRRMSLMKLMASIYLSENDREESRRLWAEALKKNVNDHDALVGLMQLELRDGNFEEAQRYLERASKNATAGRQAKIELAMLAMMKNDLPSAKQQLQKLVDADFKDLQAWSLLAAVTIQQIDNSKSEAEKKKLTEDLEKNYLPAMDRAGAGENNYYVQMVKGFVLLRHGAEKRQAARDAFVEAAKARPDVAATQDLVIGMDISLGDSESAEAHARDILRRNRNAPLANYAMGSLALGKSNLNEAEIYLRKAVEAPQPSPVALNDFAETLRRLKKLSEAEFYARKAVADAPKLAPAWDTLGAVLLDVGKDLQEAEACVNRACELSKTKTGADGDVRMLISLARVQLKRDDKLHARLTLRKVAARLNELTDYERKEFEAIRDGAK